ncbi:N-acetyltransferase [Mucilaginibacter sp. RS28]|uniref:N-acetyltransferase n=1 Tax=Mucilaginibacter straminoryzae TaxID=2932774 RepID=A0A9X1X4D5_9SPHI|nr:GNAT family N-acetyltransferase [Mucilaginibacter straminoryzae]MCJ8210997.1 N-acetyltransferase [Mucilaginibacter straminoryzae]
MELAEIPLINNEAIHNFELVVDGHRAFIDYRTKDNRIYLVHTEVPVELKGRGVGDAIVLKAFHYIEERGLKMVPLCKFVQLYLQRHPEWNRLVA